MLIISKIFTQHEKFIVIMQDKSEIALNITELSKTDTNALMSILIKIRDKDNA